MKTSIIRTLTVLTAVLVGPVAQAAVNIYFGQTLGSGEDTRLTPNASTLTAQSNFLGALSSPGVESFESFSPGLGAPLNATFGNGVTAVLSGDGSVVSVPSGTNGFGRYPVSGDQFWQVEDEFTVSFSESIRAFGFFGVDLGDFNGQLKLDVFNGGSLQDQLTVPYDINAPGGGIVYYGFVTSYDFTSVVFSNTASGVDVFAFDDFTVGLGSQIVDPPGGLTPIPEPSTYGIFGAVLMAGLVAYRRRRKAAPVVAV